MHARIALGLAACLGFGAAAVAETASDVVAALPSDREIVRFQAPLLPKSGSTTDLAFRADTAGAALRYPDAIQPAYDPFDDPTPIQTASDVEYTATDQPTDHPLELGGADERPPAICDAAREKPPGQLTIDIDVPAGLVPRDHAAECWPEIAGSTGANPLVRCWPRFCYHWKSTCLAYRPLYFEEINLERHGYGLGDLCQPVVSGAHFFGTVPCLPYLMAVNPPGECIYTLGHYRPGSCPPWQHHWPPLSVAGGLSEAGVITGLILLIP